MKLMDLLGLLLLIASTTSESGVDNANHVVMTDEIRHTYHSVVEFKLNQVLTFPDFTLEHTKHETVQGPNDAPWQRQTFLFIVKNGDNSQEIAWRTGLTQNTKFTIKGMPYELVMGSYPDPNASKPSFKNLALNELMILKPKQVEFSKQLIQSGDIIFRSTQKKAGVMLFNEHGVIEKTLLGIYVWDLRNTLKQPLKSWAAQSIDHKIGVFRKKSADFQMNEAVMKDGSYNYLFDSAELELVTKNF